jgi:hypothetical protein
MIESVWAKTEEEAARLQADGWRPARGAHVTHHAEYGILLVREVEEPEITGEAA